MAIVLPDRDVSPHYQAISIETKSGRTHTGLILCDTTNQTVRIEAADIGSKFDHNRTLMPTGQLKDLIPTDLADMYRYLQFAQ